MNDMVNPGHLGIPMLLTVKRQDSAPGGSTKVQQPQRPQLT